MYNPHHFTRAHDLRSGTSTAWSATRDWRQVARAARGVQRREDAKTRAIMDATRALWSLSRRVQA